MRCGNSDCRAEAMYLRSGSLYYIDMRDAGSACGNGRKQLIWLCAECSQHYKVETWRPAGQQLQHQDEPAHRRSMLSYQLPKVVAA